MTVTTPAGRINRKHPFHNDAGTYTVRPGLGSRATVTVYDTDTLQTCDTSMSRIDRDTVSIGMNRIDWDGSDNPVAAPVEHDDLIVVARCGY